MEETWTNSLEFKHISHAIKDSLDYIEGRRTGRIKSLKTGFNKLDQALLDGIEWNKIFSIGAMSGSGKSVLCEQLKRQICDLNPNEKLKILSFEFEMPSYEQITRNISGKLNMSTKQIYSGDSPVTDKQFEYIKNTANSFNKYPIFTVEKVGDIEQIVNTIFAFIKRFKMHETGEGLMVTIDHALLTKMKQGEREREMLAHLYRRLVEVKKILVSEGINCLFIILNQLNRNIETVERLTNPELQYPNRNDLFGSNDIFMGSDYVLIIHKPAILNLQTYGLNNLPVFNPHNPDQAMLYLHLIKQRSGEPKIIRALDDFRNSKIQEFI